jgi:chromosome segregation ATPase
MRLPVSSTLEVPHGKDPAWERLEALEKKLAALDARGWNADEQIEDLQLADNTLLKPVMSRIYGIEAKIREQDTHIDNLRSSVKRQVDALNLKHHQYTDQLKGAGKGIGGLLAMVDGLSTRIDLIETLLHTLTDEAMPSTTSHH